MEGPDVVQSAPTLCITAWASYPGKGGESREGGGRSIKGRPGLASFFDRNNERRGGLQPRSTEGEGEPEQGRKRDRSLLSEARQSLKFSTRKGGRRQGGIYDEGGRQRGDGVTGRRLDEAGAMCLGKRAQVPGRWPVRPLQWNATANMRVRREWEEWVTRGVRKERNLDAGNGEWGMGNGGRGEGACKKICNDFHPRKGRKVRTASMGSVTRGGLEASRRGKERRERAQKSRPSNLEQSKEAHKCLTCQGDPRLPEVPAVPCTSGNRNDGPLPWQTNKLQTHSHTPTLRIQANSRGPLRSQYRRPHSIPWLARTSLYINGCIILSVWDLSRRPMTPMAPCARPMLPMADNAKPTGTW